MFRVVNFAAGVIHHTCTYYRNDMKKENRFCVYFHYTKETDTVFYVGIGTGYRPNRISGRSELWKRMVDKYGFYSKVIHSELTWSQACEYEKEYIKKFGRRNVNTGFLVNLTDGGDGTPGCTWNSGSKRTDEQRMKISQALKGRKVSPEAIKKSVEAKKTNRLLRQEQGEKTPIGKNERANDFGRVEKKEFRKSKRESPFC
jgi:hypothetical protein